MSTSPSTVSPAPLYLAAAQPTERNRLTAALRIIWVIPQVFVLFFVYIAAFAIAFIGWFGALFTGTLPAFAYDFLSGTIRWGTRVSGYAYFLTDEYPPFSLQEEPSYPIHIAIPPPGAQLNRAAVLFRIFLVLPASILASVLGSGVFFLAAASWAMILFTGAQPIPLYEVIRVVTRYHLRVSGYFFMMTAEYPWGVMGDTSAPVAEDVAAGDGGWTLRLSPGGRTAWIVAIVLGVITTLFNNRYRG